MKTPHSHSFHSTFATVACIASLALASQLHAQTVITTSTGDGADTFANRTSSATNYGANTTFQVRGSGSSDDRMGYLRFDLGSTNPATITSPSLQLVAAGAITANFTLWGLVNGTNADAVSTSGGWSETGLTYANASGRSGNSAMATSSGAQAGTPSSYAVQIGTFSLSGLTDGSSFTLGTGLTNATQSTDLTANLLSFLQSDTNQVISFVFTSSTNSSSAFYSKEFSSGSNAPALSFSAVPEPSTYALLAGGMMMSVALLRRRRSQS